MFKTKLYTFKTFKPLGKNEKLKKYFTEGETHVANKQMKICTVLSRLDLLLHH